MINNFEFRISNFGFLGYGYLVISLQSLMQLTPEEVKHIAKLARLKLSDEEVKKFSEQLSSILSHADMLNEVDTNNVEPIAQITGIENVLFKDEIKGCDHTDKLLKETPQDIQDHMIKVKNVF